MAIFTTHNNSITVHNVCRSILHLKPMKVARLMLPPSCGPCLPLDWVLLPLIQEYNKAVDPKNL